MPSRIVIRNKTWLDRGYSQAVEPIRQAERAAPFKTVRSRGDDGRLHVEKQLVDVASAIPPDSAESPFRAGVAVRDEVEGIVYRVVAFGVLNPQDRWFSTRFWQDRWGISHKGVCALVERGWLDAAMEEGSEVRKYRCRDEGKVKKFVGKLQARKAKIDYKREREQHFRDLRFKHEGRFR